MAKPDSQAASDIAVRASWFEGSRTAVAKFFIANDAARRACVSEKAVCRTAQKASMACESASKPVEAVTKGGMEYVKLGSKMARSGKRKRCLTVILFFCSVCTDA